MGGRKFASNRMQMGKNSCTGFVPLGVNTVTSVRLQVSIGKYGYQHIGMTRKNRYDITDEDIRRNVKFAATELDYFCTRGIPVDNVKTHSL